MKSVKLSKWDKESLVDDLLEGIFDKKEKKLQESIDKFGEKLYIKFVFPYLHTMGKLPSGALVEEDEIWVRLNSDYRKLFPKFKEKKKFLRGFKLIPDFDVVKDKPEAKEFEKLMQKRHLLSEERKSTRSKTEGAIRNINTSKQLQEHWPEAYEVFKKSYIVTGGSLLPVIPRSEMNKILGLKEIKS